MSAPSAPIVMLAPFGIRPKGTLSARMLPLAQALVRQGQPVTIVAPPVQNPEDAGTTVVLGGVRVIHTQRSQLPGPVGELAQVGLLLQAARAEQPDLLHLFKPKGYSGLAALLAQQVWPRLPLVVDTDDWEGWGGWNDLLPYPNWAKQLFAWQEQDLPRRAAAVTVVSRTLEWQVRGAGVAQDRIFYLPNGMLAERGSLPIRTERPPTLLLYTRFWEFSIDFLLQAFALVVQQYPAVRLLIIGRGERGEEQQLLAQATQMGVIGQIDYCGWVEPEAIPALLAGADVALVPMNDTLINRARGLAKLLELMSYGLPIVANRVGQVAEYLVDRQSGVLVPPGDVLAFAQAALLVLTNQGLQAELAAGAQARAALFGWDRLAETAALAYQRARI